MAYTVEYKNSKNEVTDRYIRETEVEANAMRDALNENDLLGVANWEVNPL